jgi:protein ImuB
VRAPFVGIDGDDGQGRGVVLDAPWPGRVPSPLPTLLPTELLPIQVLDVRGASVWVSGRGTLSAEPSMVRLDDATRGGVSILGWAGPWPCDERWWDQRTHRRRARLQLALADGRALLVQIEQGSWSVEAIYD